MNGTIAALLLSLSYVIWPASSALAETSPSHVDRAASAALAARSTSSPLIVTREGWRAKPPAAGMEPQVITGIILHNTGIRKNFGSTLENKMRGLQNFSQNRGQVSPGHWKPAWPDVPYHFYIDAVGRIAEGRSVNFAGDTNTNYNTVGFIQVVVEGDFERELPSAEQLVAVRDLLVWLLHSRGLKVESISVHKDHASTDCPGRNFMAVLPRLLAQVNEKLASASNH